MTEVFARLPLAERVVATVALIERRGFSVGLTCLADWLLGGPVPVEAVREVVLHTPGLHLSDGLVHSGAVDGPWLERSRARQRCHREHRHRWWPEVERYVQALVARCPQVRCVALAGSMAAGGFVETDDVDFNLFVADHTRYTTYLQASALALGFSVRHRRRPVDAHSRRVLFPKLMSINVIWQDGEARPFVRQDSAMALELMLSEPIWGGEYFRGLLGCNRWLDDFFPQCGAARNNCERPTAVQPSALTLWRERLSYRATYLGWRWVMWTRRGNPVALERVAQVRRHQSPYALFEAPP
jgi:hypothetical protein